MKNFEDFGPIAQLTEHPDETDVSTTGEVRRVAQIEFAEIAKRIIGNSDANNKLSPEDVLALRLIEQSLSKYRYEGRGYREYGVDLRVDDETIDTIAPTSYAGRNKRNDFVMINATNPRFTKTTPIQNFQLYYQGATADNALKDADINCCMYAYTFGLPNPHLSFDYLTISNRSTNKETAELHHQVISCYVFDANNSMDTIEDEVEKSFGESGHLDVGFSRGTARLVQNYRSLQDHTTYHREYDLIDLGIVEMDGGKRTRVIVSIEDRSKSTAGK